MGGGQYAGQRSAGALGDGFAVVELGREGSLGGNFAANDSVRRFDFDHAASFDAALGGVDAKT